MLLRFFGAVTLAFLTTISVVEPSRAQEITLKQINGTMVVSGTLLKYNGQFYEVDSNQFGRITVEAKRFICVSDTCPEATSKRPAVKTRNTVVVSNDFAIHGSNTIGAQLMPALIEGFAKSIGAKTTRIVGNKSEEIKLVLNSRDGKKIAVIDLHSLGSGTAAPGLANGTAQIGMSSRAIKEEEIDLLSQAGITGITNAGNENIVALDGLIVIVSPSNPVQSLTIEQIAKIFSGQITDWSQVGRPTPGPINIYSRDRKSGTYDTFESLVLKPYKLKLSQKAKRYESSPDLSDAAANDPNGIGFAGFAYKRNAKVLSIDSACGISMQATLFNVKTEGYPLARRLYLYKTSKTLRSPIGKRILKFSLSDKAQNIIRRVGYINQSIESLGFSRQGDRIAAALNVSGESFNLDMVKDFTREFKNARRLSVTFRFQAGSTKLTNKSKDDIVRLIKLLKSKAFNGKQAFLVGFSDSKGAFDLNRELAFKRALAVKFNILSMSNGQIASDTIKMKSYGELFPIACNSNPTGQAINRRVEVWVK